MGENAFGVNVSNTHTWQNGRNTIPVMLDIYNTRSVLLFSIFASILALQSCAVGNMRIHLPKLILRSFLLKRGKTYVGEVNKDRRVGDMFQLIVFFAQY